MHICAVRFRLGTVGSLARATHPTLIPREPAYTELYLHLLVSRTLLLSPCPSRSSVSGATSTIHDNEWGKKSIALRVLALALVALIVY